MMMMMIIRKRVDIYGGTNPCFMAVITNTAATPSLFSSIVNIIVIFVIIIIIVIIIMIGASSHQRLVMAL